MTLEFNDSDFEWLYEINRESFITTAGEIRINNFTILKDRPCKIVWRYHYGIGKGNPGYRRYHLTGIDIFNENKEQIIDVIREMEPMELIRLRRDEYLLLDVADDGFMTLMHQVTQSVREDLKCTTDAVGKKLKTEFAAGKEVLCTILSTRGEEKLISIAVN